MRHDCTPLLVVLPVVLLAANISRAVDDARLDVRETPVGTTGAAVVETITSSPDGRRLAHAARDGDKLVLMVDGKPTSKAYDGFALNGIVFSPDGRRVAAMVSPSADKWLLLVDGREGEPYDVFVKDSLTFSPDSAHVAVVAAKGPKRLAVIDGKAGPPFDDVKAFAFGPTAGEAGRARYAYAARTLANWTVVTGAGPTDASYDAVGDAPVLFSSDGTRHVFTAVKSALSFARPPRDVPRAPAGDWFIEGADARTFDEIPPAGIRFSPGGDKVAYLGRDREWWLVCVDGEEEPDEYLDVVPRSLAWRADGSLVLAARTARGWTVVDGRKPGPTFEQMIFPPVLSADRKHVVYVGGRGGRHVVVTDGAEGEPCDEVMETPLVSAGGRVAYAARNGGQQFVVVDGKSGPAFHAVGRLAFSPDGVQLAYGAQRGNESVIRVGDRETPAFSGFLPRSRLVFEKDGSALHAQTFRGEQLLQVRIPLGKADLERRP